MGQQQPEYKDLLLVIIKGLQGSGKSTLAYKMVEQGRAQEPPVLWKVIERDQLRRMLDGPEYLETNEAFVRAMRNQLILLALAQGYNVICSDTNLGGHERTLRNLVQRKATVEVIDLTEVPLEECRRRNRCRVYGHVDDAVIVATWRKYIATHEQREPAMAPPPVYNYGLSDAVICDIDNTLAHCGNRGPYDHVQCERDTLNTDVLDTLDMHRGVAQRILLVSGREEQFRPQTERWLLTHGVRYDVLWMRPTGDHRKDVIIKREIYDREIAGKYNIRRVFDDRTQVVDFWRSLGLPCYQVRPSMD